MIENILPIDIKLCLLIFLFFSQSDGNQERHYLLYEFTALTKTESFPAFSAVCVSDDRLIAHYSNAERVWIRENLTDWTKAPAEPPESRDWYLKLLSKLSNCTKFAECPELHVLQGIIGCELEKFANGTMRLNSLNNLGFDGKEIHSFNYDNMQWIDKSPKAKETKKKWDRHTGRNQSIKRFLKTCTDWILTFNNTYKSSPDVFVFASKSPDDESKLVLVCLATGFYPRDVQMYIRLNRINLENQTSSGIRPNDDETFQKRISVKIDRNHEGSYDCLVTHSSLTEPVSVNWDGKCIDCKMSRWQIITGVIAVVVIILLFCWIVYKLKRFYGPINSDDDDDDDDDDDADTVQTEVIKPVKRSKRRIRKRRGLKC